jgi:predicted RNase H-like HicB family nuclease
MLAKAWLSTTTASSRAGAQTCRRRIRHCQTQPASVCATVFGQCYIRGRVIPTIELEREDDGRWLAEVEALPGVMCYGQGPDEAVAKAQALARRVIAERLDYDEDPTNL